MTYIGLVTKVVRVGSRVVNLQVNDKIGSVTVMVPKTGVDKVVVELGLGSVKSLVGVYKFDLSKLVFVKSKYWHKSLVGSHGKSVSRNLYRQVKYGTNIGLYIDKVIVILNSISVVDVTSCFSIVLSWSDTDCGLGNIEADSVVKYVGETVHSRLVKILLLLLGRQGIWSQGDDAVKATISRYCVDLDRVIWSRISKVGLTGSVLAYKQYLVGLVRVKDYYKCNLGVL
jgi:hypothetical protein